MLSAPDFGSTLTGVFRLHPAAFEHSAALPDAGLVALAVVLLAGLSEAIAQSIVLFANRVKPVRFFFSLLIDAVLFAFGYAFVVLSTWVAALMLGRHHLSVALLAIVIAMSYAPLLFSFLGALPYAGVGILWALRIWNFLAMVVGVTTITGDSLAQGLTYVILGWFVLSIAQQTFGRPIAALGVRVADAVAGVNLQTQERSLISRLGAALLEPSTPVRGGNYGAAASGSGVDAANAAALELQKRTTAHPGRWRVVLSGFGLLVFAVIVGYLLSPVRSTILGWGDHAPTVLQVPLHLVWILIVGAIVAAFLAPLETLGWWAGWYGDQIDTTSAAPTGNVTSDENVERYVVYLDGISQSSSRYTDDIETFLDALAPALPPHVRLIRGIMAYSVLNRPLEDDPIFAGFWTLIDKLRFSNKGGLLGMFVNLRNVLIVAVSADPRYGPIYNFGIAQIVYNALLAGGYRRRSGVPVTLIGYSGGGQMSCACAGFLRHALQAPIDVISLGGVISGNCRFLTLEHLYHLVGDRDKMERLGPVIFPSRWKLAFLSYWNRARRLGLISWIDLGPVGHQVPGGMLDPNARLPDGRTNLQQTLDDIGQILRGDFVDPHEPPPKPSEYELRVAAQRELPNSGLRVQAVPAQYAPVAAWSGRLILPSVRERQNVRGVWFEVRHAPDEYAALNGRVVKLRWSRDPAVRDAVRNVTRDVHFSAIAEYTSRHGGLVQPVRLDHRLLVDPLESLAGAHPYDDVLVMLRDPVEVITGDDPEIRIASEPVQIAAPYYAVEDGAYVFGDLTAQGFAERARVSRDVMRAEEDPGGAPALLVQISTDERFEHFAYGFGKTVVDPIAKELRYDLVSYHLYPSNTLGAISGAIHWSLTPLQTNDALVRCSAFEPVLERLRAQLEAMAARYRIGNGRGATYAGPADNSAQDSNRALYAALGTSALEKRLRRKLTFFGAPREDWRKERYMLGRTFEDEPMQMLRDAVGSWRTIFPREAFRTIVRTFEGNGATITRVAGSRDARAVFELPKRPG